MQRAVGDVEVGAVERDGQQALEAGTGDADRRGRPAQEIEQRTHRTYSESGPGVPQRRPGDLRDRYCLQRGGELAPDGQLAALLEQGGGQQQVDHHPGGKLPQSLLGRTGLGKGLIDHVERDDLGEFPQMTRGEQAIGYRDFTCDDTLIGQRSSRVGMTSLGRQVVLPGLRFLRPAFTQIRTHLRAALRP